MTVYVLTQTDGKKSSPVAVVTSERKASEWYKAPGNDYFAFQVDELSHLGEGNGEEFVPAPPLPVRIPCMPDIDPKTGSAALHSLTRYLEQLADSIEFLQQSLGA